MSGCIPCVAASVRGRDNLERHGVYSLKALVELARPHVRARPHPSRNEDMPPDSLLVSELFGFCKQLGCRIDLAEAVRTERLIVNPGKTMWVALPTDWAKDDEPAAPPQLPALVPQTPAGALHWSTCPITRMKLIDPAVASDGHVYEHEAITAWIAADGRSPMTGRQLRETVYRCHLLRHLMQAPEFSSQAPP